MAKSKRDECNCPHAGLPLRLVQELPICTEPLLKDLCPGCAYEMGKVAEYHAEDDEQEDTPGVWLARLTNSLQESLHTIEGFRFEGKLEALEEATSTVNAACHKRLQQLRHGRAGGR